MNTVPPSPNIYGSKTSGSWLSSMESSTHEMHFPALIESDFRLHCFRQNPRTFRIRYRERHTPCLAFIGNTLHHRHRYTVLLGLDPKWRQ
ncbi:hypothetical protein J6590_010010 [Homalodisca vitripennis]|nr:hypothetical protein J6590_010010 [Homalodisca vitripennis]